MRSRWRSTLAALAQVRLGAAQRGYLLAAICVALLAVAYVDYRHPDFKLAPSAVLFVIAIAGVGGLWIGLAGALLVALLFSLAESGGANGSSSAVVAHTLLRSTSYIAAALLVILFRNRSASLLQNQARLREFELQTTRDQLGIAEAGFRAVGESLPFGVWYCNPQGRVIHMSESFLQMTGMTLEDVRAGGWLARVEPHDAERIRAAWSQREQWTGNWEDEYRITGADGTPHTIMCRGRAVRDERGAIAGWAGINLDITEQAKSRERLAFLADAGRVLALSLDPEATLQRIAGLLVPRLADWCEIALLDEDGAIRTLVALHANPEKAQLAHRLRAALHHRDDTSALARVVRTGTPELIPLVTNETIFNATSDEDERRGLAELAATSAMVVPLRARDKIFGSITLAQAESGRTFDADDLTFIVIVSSRAALAYDNARSYAREHLVAHTLQTASLPTTLPRIPGVVLQASYRPGALESEIGGDWYDAFVLQDGNVAISIGDVAGKGLRAAVAMSGARHALRAAALDGASPKDVLQRANVLLVHEDAGMVTSVFGIFDPVTLRVVYANAGHPPPLLATTEGALTRLPGGGLPLGLFVGHQYEEQSAQLEPGSLLVMYTDGLVEYDRDVIAGEAALAEAVHEAALARASSPAEGIIERVVRGVAKDDVAVLTLCISAEPVDQVDIVLDATPASARVLRQVLRRLALHAGLGESDTTDVLVASGEAISNVIEHAYGIKDGDVRVRASRRDGELSVEIADRGQWRETPRQGGGRGLMLMRALMTHVEVAHGPGGTTVYLRKALAGEL
ncbi:MAG: SpoIIE family protein phosphatase [Candidatus Eremiobacteraeota bacterium]|nr:SpoIIE family protein phosphatase [Candidatus Eremiobacteraeota bacterium]